MHRSMSVSLRSLRAVAAPKTAVKSVSAIAGAKLFSNTFVSKVSAPLRANFEAVRTFAVGGQNDNQPQTILLRHEKLGSEDKLKEFLGGYSVHEVYQVQLGGEEQIYNYVTMPRGEVSRLMASVKNMPFGERPGIRNTYVGEVEDAKAVAGQPSTYVAISGLPFYAGPEKVREFFSDLNVQDVAVLPGRAVVKLGSVEDVTAAIGKSGQDFEVAKPRVYRCYEMDFKQVQTTPLTLAKVTGMPYDSTDADVKEFLTGLNVQSVFTVRREVEGKGEVSWRYYVKFATPEELQAALSRNGTPFGNRKIFIRPSSNAERAVELKKSRRMNFDGENTDRPEQQQRRFRPRGDRPPRRQEDQQDLD